jgi:hypothetical protein
MPLRDGLAELGLAATGLASHEQRHAEQQRGVNGGREVLVRAITGRIVEAAPGQ